MSATVEQKPRQILVVDDEPDLELLVRQRFRRQIREGEFEFFFSHNGEEALLALDGKPTIDVVLSDINMPVMDGLTLLGKLRERRGCLKAVVVSAYGDMPNIRMAMNRGAIDFLMKPIDFEDLEITIRKTLDHVAEIRQWLKAQESLLAIRQELSVAAQIQQSILPRIFPPFPSRKDFELHACMIPAKEVGGDLFDFFLLDEDHLGLVVGDVSGKGVPAALFMAVSRTLLRATALQKLPPGECLQYVNATLTTQNPSHMFVTMFYGILNTRTGELRYANGGHNPPYVVSRGGVPGEGVPGEGVPGKGVPGEGKVRELPGDKNGMIVGLMEGAAYQTASYTIAPGEALVVYTDGVTEAMNRGEDFFGEERLEALLARDGALPADKLVARVMASVEEFAGGMPQSDDITVLAIRYLGN